MTPERLQTFAHGGACVAEGCYDAAMSLACGPSGNDFPIVTSRRDTCRACLGQRFVYIELILSAYAENAKMDYLRLVSCLPAIAQFGRWESEYGGCHGQ